MDNMKITVNPMFSGVDSFAMELHANFESEGEVLYDRRNKVKCFTVNGLTLVVKRYKRPFLLQRFDYTFIRKSKARRAYSYALRLKDLCIDTPEAVACVEAYKHGLFDVGYFVSTYCGDPDLKILKETPDDGLIAAFAHFLVNMHSKGVLHGDLNLSNILYRPDETEAHGYHFTVIDTNRSRFVDNPSQRQCLRNLVRVSHDRQLNERIISHYAQIRGWDQNECVRTVERMLDTFEKKRHIKRKIKNKK